jgi:hypothetical protein
VVEYELRNGDVAAYHLVAVNMHGHAHVCVCCEEQQMDTIDLMKCLVPGGLTLLVGIRLLNKYIHLLIFPPSGGPSVETLRTREAKFGILEA